MRSAVRLARATLTARPIQRAPIEPTVAGSSESRLVRDRFFQFRGLRAPARSRPSVIFVRAGDAWLPPIDMYVLKDKRPQNHTVIRRSLVSVLS